MCFKLGLMSTKKGLTMTSFVGFALITKISKDKVF